MKVIGLCGTYAEDSVQTGGAIVILKLSQPYERALLDTLRVRVEAARQLLETNRTTKYRAWWRAMKRKEGENPTKAEADRFVKFYQGFTRRVVEEGYRPDDANPIRVTIGDRGQLGCSDGNHRLCALAAAGVEEVEVVVCATNERWSAAVKSLKGTIYQPHPHPLFGGWPVIRPETPVRYRQVAERILDMGCGSVFEIGPCSGAGPQAMAGAGLSVFWTERSETYALLCRSLSFVGQRTKEVRSIEQAPKTDAVVALAVWHHVATCLDALDGAAKRLSGARVHVVELPTPDAPRWHKQYIEDSGQTVEDLPEWTLDRLQRQGRYTHREVLREETYGGRTTWILWR